MHTTTEAWDYQGNWLNQFPQNTRGTIMNLFCYAVRDNCETESEVLQRVEYQALRHRGRNSYSHLTDEWLNKLIDALLQEEAGDLAAHILWRERLPQADRERLKSQASKPHIASYMSQQAPTEKQLKYLRSLGCKETPTSKQEASEWIDARVSR